MSRTWLVTGAGRGIGLEMCRVLRKRGDVVIGTVRSESAAASVAALGCEVQNVDVSEPGQIAELSRRLTGRAVDVLVNNAGVSATARTAQELNLEELERVFRVNAHAPLLVARELLPNLRAGSGRLIVNITSQLASIANNTGGSSYPYRASKAALNQLSVSLANELRPEGFRVVMMHPGWVRTDMGGANATLSVEESVSTMIRVMDGLKAESNGSFLNYDGQRLPW